MLNLLHALLLTMSDWSETSKYNPEIVNTKQLSRYNTTNSINDPITANIIICKSDKS